jgi:hypothetical protein
LKNVNQILKKLHGYEHISFVGFLFQKEKLKKIEKKGKKGNRKTNFIFWKFKDHKK